MLFICIPAHNEAETVGVLLWRIRTVFREYARDYELVVYDDGSTDATAEVLEPYTKVLPLTVLRGGERKGYAAAVDALCRHVSKRTSYPRRDAMVLMQGDFTDSPEHLPELVKRFEGGADVVVAERGDETRGEPTAVRRLRKIAPWVLRPFVRIDGVSDLTSPYRLVRISVLRDLLRERGSAPIVAAAGWAANVELLLAVAPYARRIEAVALSPRYDVRSRESRVRAGADAVALARFAWRARGRRVSADRRLQLPPAAEASAAAPPAAAAVDDAPPRGAELTRAEGPSRRERAPKAPRPPRADTADAAAEEAPRERKERAPRATRAPKGERSPREPRTEAAPPADGEERPARRERPAARRREADHGPEDTPATPETERVAVVEATPGTGATESDALDATAVVSDEPGEAHAAEPLKRSRRRRRRKKRGTGAAGESEASGAPGDEGELDETAEGGQVSDAAGPRRAHRERTAAAESGGYVGDRTADASGAEIEAAAESAEGDEATDGDSDEGGEAGGADSARRHSRRRRRGRRRSGTARAEGAGDADGGESGGAGGGAADVGRASERTVEPAAESATVDPAPRPESPGDAERGAA